MLLYNKLYGSFQIIQGLTIQFYRRLNLAWVHQRHKQCHLLYSKCTYAKVISKTPPAALQTKYDKKTPYIHHIYHIIYCVSIYSVSHFRLYNISCLIRHRLIIIIIEYPFICTYICIAADVRLYNAKQCSKLCNVSQL